MVVSKTGSLLRLMTREICVLYEADALVNSFVQIVENLAICFQIRDDIINLQSEMGKGIKGEDLL
jgi:geranylgeranyl pyrophosphate synthase